MPAPTERAVLSLLLTCAVCANLLELFIPSPPFLPWLKPGIANAFTLCAIFLFGARQGLALAALRSLLSAFLGGLPVTSFLIGGAGGIASAAVMGIAWHFLGKRGLLSLPAAAVAGALTHTLTQLAIVHWVFIRNANLFWQVPFTGPVALVTGGITGLVAVKTARIILRNLDCFDIANVSSPSPPEKPPLFRLALLIFSSLLLFFLSSATLQLIFCIALAPILVIAGKKRGIFVLLRFIPMFLLAFLLNAFSEPGHYLPWLPGATREGVMKGVFLVARLTNLTLVSLLLFDASSIRTLLTWTGKQFPAISNLTEIALRSLTAIPAAVGILKDFYVHGPEKGMIRRLKYLFGGFEEVFARVAKVV